MKRPRTRVAKAIAIRAYHIQMNWLHELGKEKYAWDRGDRKLLRWIINKEVDKPKRNNYDGV